MLPLRVRADHPVRQDADFHTFPSGAAGGIQFGEFVEGGHRVVFLSSDQDDAIAPVTDLAKKLGFAPVTLGRLDEGGALVHARGRSWGQLIFQDLFKTQQ